MRPGKYEKEEAERVKALRIAARANSAHIRQSNSIKCGKVVLSPGRATLGFSSAIAMGDYMMREMERDEEIRSQHGPVRILMKNGKLVDG